jgi:hypothetical protein
VNPTPHTLREVVWMACGAMDRDLHGRAFWMAAFGQKPTAAQLLDMHPIRRAERPPLTPENREAIARRAWRDLDAFFTQTRS